MSTSRRTGPPETMPRPVAPPRPSLPYSHPSERSGTRPPSEGSGSRPPSEASAQRRARDELAMREETDLAEAAFDRAVKQHLFELRAQNNERVRVQVLEAELDLKTRQLAATTTTLKQIDRRRPTLWTAIASLVVALCGLIVERITTGKVDERATAAAEHVVEERATPIEERADAAAVSATTNDARQTAVEARELARDAQIDALITELRKQNENAAKARRGSR